MRTITSSKRQFNRPARIVRRQKQERMERKARQANMIAALRNIDHAILITVCR